MKQHHFTVVSEVDDNGIVSLWLDNEYGEHYSETGVVWDTDAEQWYMLDDKNDPDRDDTRKSDDLSRAVLNKCLSYANIVTTFVKMDKALGDPK